MGRKPCCEKVGLKKGPWTSEEDKKLINFMLTHGQCCWRAVPKLAGLLHFCFYMRKRINVWWTNYLRPDLRRGMLSEDEEKLVIELHSQLGNRWSKIASQLPGRTDNEIKNIWNSYIMKKLRKMGIDPLTHKPISPSTEEQQRRCMDMSCDGDEQAELDCSMDSSETAEEEAKEKNTASPRDPAADASLSNCPEFCTDEVPMLQPHEILIPCDSSAFSSSCSSASSSSSSSPRMEPPEPMHLWGWDDPTGWNPIDQELTWKSYQEDWKYDVFCFDY
ncbi:hypothetical protein GW17_00032882 [Ensete ventricosum]|nr:hypothetical protein GW17_00032882 [Ensete ventricosum]